MMRANITISQKIKVIRTVEVEANNYDDLIANAKNEFSMSLIEDYDDYDDYKIEHIEIINENGENHE